MIAEFVKQYVAPILKRHGFKKRRLVWNRTRGALTHVVRLELSRWNTRERQNFRFNMGVWERRVARIAWDRGPAAWISDFDCYPRYVGDELIDGSEQFPGPAWTLTPDAATRDIGSEVQRVLEEKLLPLLDHCDSIGDMLDLARLGLARRKAGWQHPGEKLEFAVLHHLNGEYDAARDILADLDSGGEPDEWDEKIQEVKEKLAALE